MTKVVIYNALTSIKLVVIVYIIILYVSTTRQSLDMRTCSPHHHDPIDPTKISCECSKEHCDNLVFDLPHSGQLLQVVSSRLGQRFALYHDSINSRISSLSKDDLDTNVGDRQSRKCLDKVDAKIVIDQSKQYQPILGWGGALTDSSLINIDKLSKEMRTVLMENYYGADGLRYNFGRITIGSSDFSNRTYTYNDVKGPDYEQNHWALATEDTRLKIPYIKMAKGLVAEWNGNLKLLASSWSPPKWMKTNNNFVRGFLKGPSSIQGKTYRAYAKYLVKFLQAYDKHNISMWGMTLQNEPASAYLPFYFFNSLEFPPAKQRDFIKYHLGPLLEQHGYNKSNFKLIIGDDSIGIVNIQIDRILKDLSVRKYISGLGIHWYLSGFIPYSCIDRLYENHKDHVEFILSTEACRGSMPFETKVILGDWSRGEAYAKDIIEDLNRNVNGWIDWNIALDLDGGPNWAKNFVDSPIIVDYSKDKFYKNPMYYVLGHFSRFIPIGSKRIKLDINQQQNDSTEAPHQMIMTTAFILPSQKHITLVLLNLSDRSKQICVEMIGHDETLNVKLAASSITTLMYGI